MRKMKFTKMHGLGNDYVYVDCTKEPLENPEEVARFVSNRNYGIGSDGLILICPSKVADFEMVMYNADGSRGEMCGNGIRCVGKFVYDYGLTNQTKVSIETLGGIKYLELTVEDGKAVMIKVNMGAPVLEPDKIPSTFSACPAIKQSMEVQGKNYEVNAIGMGNPHCVIFVEEDVSHLRLMDIGPDFENHACFPNRVNTEFINVLDKKNLKMRVWERGSGETNACGTGACASAVAAMLNQLTEDEVTVHLVGGDLVIRWDRDANVVYMTGPATISFEGVIELPV